MQFVQEVALLQLRQFDEQAEHVVLPEPLKRKYPELQVVQTVALEHVLQLEEQAVQDAGVRPEAGTKKKESLHTVHSVGEQVLQPAVQTMQAAEER